MKFTEALTAAFTDNDHITRRTWANRNIFCAVEDMKLCIKGVDVDGLYHPWCVREEDFFADDWEVIVDG
jgi:hypothetical protein